jgi:hypothetical protein
MLTKSEYFAAIKVEREKRVGVLESIRLATLRNTKLDEVEILTLAAKAMQYYQEMIRLKKEMREHYPIKVCTCGATESAAEAE